MGLLFGWAAFGFVELLADGGLWCGNPLTWIKGCPYICGLFGGAFVYKPPNGA